MRKIRVDSLGLLEGFWVSIYESVDELNSAAKSATAALDLANKYLAEKGALVEGRDVFAEELAKATGFAMKTKTETKTYKDGTSEVVELPGETEKQYVNRFRGCIMDGSFVHADFPADEAGLEAALQKFADQWTFACDAAKPERVGKAKNPPKYALEGADSIIGNNNQAKWVTKFTEEGIPFSDFINGTPESNRIALAWAIKAREDAKAKKEYA